MFEITTRLPNSFAFKNQKQPHNESTNKYSSLSTESFNYNNSREVRRQLPVFFNHNSSGSFNNMNSYLLSKSNSSHLIANNNNAKLNSSSYAKLTESNSLQSFTNPTVLPVYYQNEVRNASMKPVLVNKINLSACNLLPPLNNIGNSASLGVGSATAIIDLNNKCGEQNSHSRSFTLNNARLSKLTPLNSIIYTHEGVDNSLSSFDEQKQLTNKMAVIKSIKARQDMLLTSKSKHLLVDDNEENQLADRTRIGDEKEMNLMKRNFSYLFMNGSNLPAGKHVEQQYRNDTPLSNLSSFDSNSLAGSSGAAPNGAPCKHNCNNNNQHKSILVSRNKRFANQMSDLNARHLPKKTVTFAE